MLLDHNIIINKFNSINYGNNNHDPEKRLLENKNNNHSFSVKNSNPLIPKESDQDEYFSKLDYSKTNPSDTKKKSS